MGFQVVLVIAAGSGYKVYRRSVPALLEFPREQVVGLATKNARVAEGVALADIVDHLRWQTDTGVYVVGEDEYWRALAVSLHLGPEPAEQPIGCLVRPKRGDSLLRLHIRGQGAREVGTVLHQEHAVPETAVRDAIETMLGSWGTLTSFSA